MNKILRYSFIALLAMVFGNVMADEATMKYSGSTTANMKADGSNEAASVGLNDSEWSVVASKGAASNAPGLNKAGDIRLYWHADGGNTITVSSLTNATISNIAITFTGADYSNVSVTANGAAVTGTDGNYAINSTSFILGNANTSNAQVRISQIVITYAGGTPITVKVPEFSVAGGLYFEPQTVSMSCEEGARILYTKPAGQDPEYTDDNQYTGVFYDGNPLTISKTTTIKAMAVKDGKTSSIVTATYTIVNTTGKGTEADPFTVADAKLVIDALENGVTTAESYYVKGYVIGTPDIQKKADGTFYGNANFDIADTKGGSDKLTCFRLKGLNNENIESEDYIKENDQVLLFGQLQKYVKNDEVTPEIVKGYIAKIEAAGPEKNETVVGQEDNSTAWWTAFSDYYTVPAQKTLHLEFENYSYMGENWHNFVVVLANSERGAEGYAEYVAVRADNFGWGAGYDENGRESNWNWDNFKTIMNGAKVKLDIIRDGAKASIKAVITGSDNNEYFQNYNNINIGDANANVVAFLTAEKAHLVIDNSATTLTDTTTGINTISADKAKNGARYNLAGQKVNAGYKGVVIMNGQKVMQ